MTYAEIRPLLTNPNEEIATIKQAHAELDRPEGWRHKGKMSKGKYQDSDSVRVLIEGSVCSACLYPTSYPILERVPWEPKVGELVFCWKPSHGIISYFFDGHGDTLIFRSEADAVEFGQQVLALADRIRAESEVQS
jgi:hypothetical protein